MSQTLDTRALNMLCAKLVAEHDRRAINLVSGSAGSFDDYRERVGFLRGLEFAKNECESVEKDLRGGVMPKKD
jgi:hypothetical protein